MEEQDKRAEASKLPERVGRYRVLGHLGSGGMGDVVLAEDERLGRRVVLKRLRRGLGPTLRARLEREARTTAQLSHPAIVQIFEVLTQGEDQLLVLELVEGETVASRLRQGPFPLPLALQLGREIAEALSEIHGTGILHRDLKAENVMVTPRQHAKVLDFGLAKALQTTLPETGAEATSLPTDSLTQPGTLLGTCRTMSPEQARAGELDARSDLFSLGVLLYEMLTGTSPFQGASQVETLSNLLTARPAQLSALCPRAPAELDRLVMGLLEKDPARRPHDADEVARALARLALETPSGELEGPPTKADDTGDTFGEAPTGHELALEATPATESFPTLGHTAPTDRRFMPPKRWVAGLGILALLMILTAAWLALRSPTVPAPSRVAVLEPKVDSPDPSGDLALLAAGVLDTCLRTLVGLEGVRVLDPSQLRGIEGSPREIGAAHAADEVLTGRILESSGLARVDLRRVSTRDGAVLWSRQISVSPLIEDALQSAEAVGTHLRQAFAARAVHPESDFEVRPEDYRRFLEIQHAVRHQNLPFDQALSPLTEVLRRSPRLTSAHWLIADLAESLYSDTRSQEHLQLAQEHIDKARRLAPGDPRPWVHEVRLALLAGELDRGEEILEALDRIAPGEPETLYSHALLAQARGDSEAAIEIFRRLVELRPSWRYLHQLASLESRTGQVDAARAHLDQLLTQSPHNTWGLGALLQLELLHGDLERAERLALELLELKEHRSYWTNLGLSRFLLGQYEGARQAYSKALDLAPNHPTTLLNLGDTLQALGRRDEAREVYGRTLEALDHRAAQGPLSPAEQINRAQCLAHLGQHEQAIESTLGVLENAGEDAELAYQSALVFALVGDQTSALIKARQALDSGMDLRWFRIPPLGSLLDQL